MRTRPRHLLIGVLAAALVLVGVPLPAHAETATPPVEQGDTPLERVASLPDAPAEVAGAGGVIALAEAAITGPTAVAGLTWDHDDEVSQAYYRFVTDGVPQEWVEIHAHHDHDHPGEDADRTPAEAEEPHSHGTPAIIITGADAVQVATVSSRPVSSSLFVASSPEVPADAEAAADASGEATGEATANRPAIRSRAAWGANEAITGLPYEYGIVSGAMIHHDAGSNNYTAAQVPSILRSIQAYHVNGRGWKDVGYNILVDKYGTAWEGRGGGTDRAVAGGHASGETNERVFGLSLLGHYDRVRPTDAMMAKAADVVAWKFSLHGVDPYGTTWGSGGQDGGSTFLNAISGHRDENATSCPGRYVYEQLPLLRASVKQRLTGVNYPVTQPQPTPLNTESAAPDVRTGKVTLAEDGVLGINTVLQLQAWLGVTEDAVWQRETNQALQDKLGVNRTGLRDRATLIALQRLVGAPESGVLDAETVRGLQRHLNRLPAPHPAVPGRLAYTAHVQGQGWQQAVADGATAGTTGAGLRLEALRLSLSGVTQSGTIQYRGHVENVGWQDWADPNAHIGVTRNGLRLEAFQARLTGELAQHYDLRYRAHVAYVGWQPFVANGATAGTTGRALPIEALELTLVPKQVQPRLTYAAHVQDIGWQPAVREGSAGTTGRALRMEALRIGLGDVNGLLDVQWRGHVQNVGWQPWATSTSPLGTVGRGLRLEALELKLTGPLAASYTIRYRAHVQDIGWQGWVADGARAGTTDQAKRIEAIQIELVRR